MKIEVDITKTKLFVLLFSIILVGGFIFVFALPAGQVPNPGHSSDELGAPVGCTPGQVLQWSGSSWTCASLNITNSTSTTITSLNTNDFCINYTWDLTRETGYKSLSLIKNGRNICEDANGCRIIATRYDQTNQAYRLFTEFNYIQSSNGKCRYFTSKSNSSCSNEPTTYENEIIYYTNIELPRIFTQYQNNDPGKDSFTVYLETRNEPTTLGVNICD